MTQMKWKIEIPDTISDIEVTCYDYDIRNVDLSIL